MNLDLREKMDLLGQAARFDDLVLWRDVDCGQSSSPAKPRSRAPDLLPYVSHVTAPDGRRRPIMKVLQTSVCQNNCRYCAFRSGRDLRRASFSPEELARGFDLLYRAGIVQGLFLSSGLAGSPQSMDTMLATATLVREKLEFRGYLHLKLLPGAEDDQIREAVRLADRVSANLEAPSKSALHRLAPSKKMAELVHSLQVATSLSRPSGERPALGAGRLGVSTQFVVGPAGESDRDLLITAERLYRENGLARAYFSAFSPVTGTPLADEPPTEPVREYRLYQADFLLRRYGFSAAELPFVSDGLLQAGLDPKSAWAQAHPEFFPVELNRASLPELLRVPGIGPVSARAILKLRAHSPMRDLGDLRRIGVRPGSAAPYVLISGIRPGRQLAFPGFRSEPGEVGLQPSLSIGSAQ